MSVDISGLNKGMLLLELWSNSKPASFFSMNGMTPPPFNAEKAQGAAQRGYIDYYEGRCIKADLTGDDAEPRLYDRDFGDGSFLRVVTDMRRRM